MADINLVILPDGFGLSFEIASPCIVRREAGHRGLHAWLSAETPLFATSKLESNVFLEVHMPVCVVALFGDKDFDLSHGVTRTSARRRSWEVACEVVAHLVAQGLAIGIAEFRRRCEVERCTFFGCIDTFFDVV